MRKTFELRIDNLIYRLNHVAEERKLIYDKLWILEEEMEKMRIELVRLINERDKC